MHDVGLLPRPLFYMTHPRRFQTICRRASSALCQRTVAPPRHPGVLLIGRINGLLFGELERPDGAQNCGGKPQSLVLKINTCTCKPSYTEKTLKDSRWLIDEDFSLWQMLFEFVVD